LTQIEKQAEHYAHNHFVMQDNHYQGLKQGFIAGIRSDYNALLFLKALLEENESILEMLKLHGTERTQLPVHDRIKELKERIKKLEDANEI
jgi:hypothetical protein